MSGTCDTKTGEVQAADFYGGLLRGYRLCKTCLAYRRPGIAEEMAVVEQQFRGGAGRARS